MAGERKIAAKVSVGGTDEARNDLKKVQNALEAFGDEGKATASKLTQTLGNIQDAADRLEKKISSGRQVTVKDVGAMSQQFELLKDQINRAFGSLDKAPKEMQQAFAVAERQLDEATRKVRTLTDAASDQKRTLDESGYAWGGLGTAIQDAAGKGGAAVGKFSLVLMALKEGLAIGSSFMRAIGFDFTYFNQIVDDAKDKTRNFLGAISESVMARFSGDVKGASDALKEAGAALHLSKEAMTGYRAALELGVTGLENYKAKQTELIEFGKVFNLTESAGRDGLVLRRKILQDSAGDLAQLGAAMAKHATDLESLRAAVQKHREEQERLNTARNDAKKVLNDILAQLATEKERRESVTGSVQDQIAKLDLWKSALEQARALMARQEEVQGGVTKTQLESLKVLEQLIPQYEKHSGEVKIFTDTLVQATNGTEALSKQQKDEIENLTGQIAKYGELSPAERGAVQSKIEYLVKTGEAARATKGLTDEQHEVKGAIEKTGFAISNAAGELEKSKTATENAAQGFISIKKASGETKGTFTDFSEAIRSNRELLPDYTRMLGDVEAAIGRITEKAKGADEAIRKMTGAMADAAGGANAGNSHQYDAPIGPKQPPKEPQGGGWSGFA